MNEHKRLVQPDEVKRGLEFEIGIEPTDNNAQQYAILLTAMGIFVDREAVRNSLWAQFDEHDALNNMRTKFRRIDAMVESIGRGNPNAHTEGFRNEIVDDAIDLINYTAFLVRHLTGQKPEVKNVSTEEYRSQAR